MRYTTVIDITEVPGIYRNVTARLVYVHLSLKAGYHDIDRDLVAVSIRRLAVEVGCTVSATRHALRLLERAHLLTREGPFWHVKKWIAETPVTARAKTARQQKAIEDAARRRQEQEQREREDAIERQRREQLAASGKTSFMLYYEGLVARAQAGDTEAEIFVEKHRDKYEMHKAAQQSKSNK